MGMYTELVVSAMIKSEPDVVAALKYMAGQTEVPPSPLPDHPFFRTDRWAIIFRCNSHYFVPLSVVRFEYNEIAKEWVLISRADLKNYGQEIEKFINWIRPYVASSGMFAYSRYEEDREPTIYYVEN